MIAMTATQVITAAKESGVKGVFIKAFKNGQVLMAYSLMVNGEMYRAEIRAMPGEHA